ncbi:DUF6798 domain-containing protein [Nitrospira moscoviensis]|nr:DUF6798 domain-containing protein [Nitrospira moscoviensis]
MSAAPSEAFTLTGDDPAAGRERRWAPPFFHETVLLAGVVLYAARYWLYWDRFVEGTMDEAIWIPLAMKWNDATIFAQDPFVPVVLPFFPVAYTWLMASMLTLWPDPGTVLLLSSSALLAIYAAGVYWLARLIVEHRLAALLIAFVSLRVNVDLSGTGWGIYLGNAMPRAFLFAATPWIGGLFIQRVRSAARLAWVGVALGVVGNLHPLSALHLYLLMTGAILLTEGPDTRLSRWSSFTGGLAVGILPYLLQWAQVRDVTPLRMEILRFRADVQSFPQWDVIIRHLLSSYLPPCLIAAVGWRCLRSPQDRDRAEASIRLALVAVTCTALGPLLAWLVPRLFAVHLLRMSGYVFLLCLLLSGFVVRELLRRGTGMMTAAGYGLAVVLFLTAGGGRIGEMVQWATGTSSKTMTALGADVGAREGGETDKQAFLDLCRWARSQTDRDALFLAPPKRFASFRIYAERALFVTFKDGAVTVFSGRSAEDWYERYREAARLYQAFQPDAVIALSQRHGIGYVVQESTRRAVDLPVVYENHRYRVYRVPAPERA